MSISQDENASIGNGRTFSFWRISFLLPLVIVGLAMISTSLVGVFAERTARNAILEEVESQLELVTESRRDALRNATDITSESLISLANGPVMATVFKELFQAIEMMKTNEEAVKKVKESFQAEDSDAVDRADYTGDNTTFYGYKHQKIHSAFYRLWFQGVFEDMYIIDKNGFIVYSVTKGPEFLKNIHSDEFKNTPLLTLFEKSLIGETGHIHASKLAPYPFANNQSSLFVATPAKEGEQIKAVLIGRLTNQFAENVLNKESLIGKTNQTYMSDTMGHLQSLPPKSTDVKLFDNAAPFLKNMKLSLGARNIYKNENKLFAVTAINFFGSLNAIVSEITVEEATAQVSDVRWSMIYSSLGVQLVVLLLGIAIARYFSTPLSALNGSIDRISKGNFEENITDLDRKDEIGDIAKAVEEFKQRLTSEREMRDVRAREQMERNERAKQLEILNNDFDRGVREVLDLVEQAGDTLDSTARSMAEMSEQTNSEAQTVSSASEQSLMNLQAVAGATEELSATVGEIDREIRLSSDISKEAEVTAESASKTVHGLQDAAARIGEVVSLINDIAEQTNLLALNATIEAARAGDAGRGFAVVASEVKELANQTGNATGEISQQIQSVQSETNRAVAAIDEITKVIARINEVSTAVAGAAEEQSVTATEISGNIQQVTAGSTEVAAAITRVSEIAQSTGSEAQSVLTAAEQLSYQSETLSKMVESYLAKVRKV
ncbi:methyl-accepting chemotaxis protein [Polycladidibacter stylochi]|uniref:methyl-accepting chemotaxis protein n=1 Tax=Polycladidibacter stylochi TaxID=1807766 RepID=UPI000833EE30|nr:HAMP domain-containing methyl-accepting chemotaxis protein [Pseudovibrio stylochi]